MADILVTRITQDLIYETLMSKLNSDIGLATGKIYLMEPEHLFTNERTEEVSGIAQTRFPSLAVFPISTIVHHTKNNTVLQDSLTATGLVKSWIGEILIEQETVFCMETATKRDFRLYHEYLIQFFNKYKDGMILINDVLPDDYIEAMNIILKGDIEMDYDHVPYKSIFTARLFYRTYVERVNYLMLSGQYGMTAFPDGTSGRLLSGEVYTF